MLTKHRMFLIFCAVGLINTAVDIVLYLLLQDYGLPIFIANIFSTSAALAVSFILNKRFTFRNSGSSHRSIVPFIAVTLTGLWILQPLIIYSVIAISNIGSIRDLLVPILNDYAMLQSLAGKIIATPATLIWNFVLYKRFVFTSPRKV